MAREKYSVAGRFSRPPLENLKDGCVTAMKKEKYTDNELFDLSVLVGNWESVNLHPTGIIYRNDDTYLLSLIHMNETSKQASPATYEIQEDEDGYFISYNLKRLSIGYDAWLDMLKLSSLGDYMRN